MNDYVQNAPERHEYAIALNALDELLCGWPMKIVVIDGKPGVGKTTLGRFLAWRFNISLIETDLYLIGNQGSYVYRDAHLDAVIRSRILADRPMIIEGVTVLSILENLNIQYDFHIHITCAQSSSKPLPEYSNYADTFKPIVNADLTLEIPVSR